MNKFQKRTGFTLPEVLITLGIIGIVAAMTISTLISNIRNKELEVKFKKSYSILSQAMQLMIMNDYNGFFNSSDSISNYNLYLSKYIKNNGFCSSGKCPAGFVYNATDTVGYNRILKVYKNYTGKAGSGFFNDGGILVSDGSYILFDVDPGNTVDDNDKTIHNKYLAIDVNGSKKPNRYGYDFFVFEFSGDGLIPSGAEETVFSSEKYCLDTSSDNKFNGFGCTEKAISDPAYFKNLK